MFRTTTSVTWNFLGCLAAVSLLVMAFYWQFGLGAEPCPLCILQRLALLGLAVFCFLSIFSLPLWFLRVCGASQFGLSGFGLWASGRQWWLQAHPSQVCKSVTEGWSEFLKRLGAFFTGSGECSAAPPEFWGITPAMGLCLIFILFLGLALFQWKK